MKEVRFIIKFWARKDFSLISSLIPDKAKCVLDPFCGSGSTGIAAVNKGISAFLSDINPVSVFITATTLNKVTLKEDIAKKIERYCEKINKEVYSIKVGRDREIIKEAVWVTLYKCPNCGSTVNPLKERNSKKLLVCRKCKRKFYPAHSKKRKEEVLEIVVEKDGKKIKITKKNVLRKYLQFRPKRCYWYPKNKFIYPNGLSFEESPRVVSSIKDIFTPRGLYAASKIYHTIEKIWKDDKNQGDLLKLAFISALFSATKMIPFSSSSGPSWKLPRYWIPHIRVERNFCETFLRKLKILREFKRQWSELICDYDVRIYYFKRPKKITTKKKFLIICRSDARELRPQMKFDLILMDPPHFDEIHYFELFYLWQCWLYGRMKDERFSDFEFWKKEIDVNPKVGRSLEDYIKEINQIVRKYKEFLTKNGKISLILHNKSKKILEKTILPIKSSSAIFKGKKIKITVPSSTQGINDSMKYLYIASIKN